MLKALFLLVFFFQRLQAIGLYDPAAMPLADQQPHTTTTNTHAKDGNNSISSDSPPAVVIPFTASRKQLSAIKSGANGESLTQGVAFLSAGTISGTLTAEIQVGNPPQPMNILFDTGSTLFWMISADCSSSDCVGQPNFDRSKSTSYARLASSQTIAQTYGDGSNVTCSVRGADTISIGSSTVIIPNQKICEATKLYKMNELQGIAGIGPPKFPYAVSADLMASMAASKRLNQNLMAMWFNTNDSATVAGELQFGGVDSSKVLGNITYYNIQPQRDYWRMSLDNITFSDGIPLPYTARSAVIDSGTTYALLARDLADNINKRIGATTMVHDLYTIDCGQVSNVQPVKFYFAGNTKEPLVLQGRQMFRHVPGSFQYRETCISIFQESPVIQNGKPVTIIGAMFLRNFVSVFHYDNQSIGFATPVGLPDPALPFGSAHASASPLLLALIAAFCINF